MHLKPETLQNPMRI